jgi:hypothetical protein
MRGRGLPSEPLQACLSWVNTNHNAQINQGAAVAVILRRVNLVRCSGAAGTDMGATYTTTQSVQLSNTEQ